MENIDNQITKAKQLMAFGTLIEMPANTFLFHSGQSIDSFYYVIEGELRALRYQASGHTSVMMRSTSGEFFAAASLSMDCYPCDAFAPINTVCLKMSKAEFMTELGKSEALSHFFTTALSLELKKQCGRLERLRLQTAKERILHFINCETAEGKHLKLNCSLQHWAEELGIEAESLYRTLKQMEKSRIIQRNKREITLIDNPCKRN